MLRHLSARMAGPGTVHNCLSLPKSKSEKHIETTLLRSMHQQLVYQLLLRGARQVPKRAHCILLTNEKGLPRKDRVGKVWSRKRKADKSRVLGRYHGRSRSSLPYIELRVDKIVRG